MDKVATIRRVREEYGILGNMSPHPVKYKGVQWRTTEALFQALRFSADDPACEEIRADTSPMVAKFTAKRNKGRMIVEPMGEQDLANMRIVLMLKLEAHKTVQEILRSTEGLEIVEDCTNRQRGSGLFWGAALQEDGSWNGLNWLGVLWMEIRTASLKSEPLASFFAPGTVL